MRRLVARAPQCGGILYRNFSDRGSDRGSAGRGGRSTLANKPAQCALRKPVTCKHSAARLQQDRQGLICKAASPNDAAMASEGWANSEETYDVYVSSPKQLEEGVEKHVISVFVADEAGIINRVAGVFARRAVNIESLAVGLNVNKALFTIVVNGTPTTIATLVKHLAKLVKVRYVEDMTESQRIDRELALFKLGVHAGAKRSAVLELASVFNGKVVDVGHDAVTVAISGDPGKLFAFESAARGYRLQQLSRTGRISLRKGDAGLDMGGMTYGPGAQVTREMDAANASRATLEPRQPDGTRDGADVYTVDAQQMRGVWNVRNILDPVYEEPSTKFRPFTLAIEVSDVPGVLNEVTGVLARRGYNVQSLAVGTSETRGRSRIITVVPGLDGSISNLVKQLQKLVVVHQVTDMTNVPQVSRELALVKVRCTPFQRTEIKTIADIYGANVAQLTLQTMTLEIIGNEERMRSAQEILAPYGIIEFARTGRVALERNSKVDSKLLDRSNLGSV